ncbi:sugar ABC transporter permease [Paenibacillus alginolyticus]|uniref:Sugar ABC transporter permease n=1 Tax=Paenibacillus alginolyticus TaxID=59839 RepID=A0ABT4GCH7_9BACL|nr:sugar ABC transporter permease [Paenibacillus alginolyticus]MCY9664302.1 sugar ABC transporter permease [Paenibacillus alginolyticus]MCY9693852.1 sugar ABC transporter permease [Paenibacillus alginolyticus]MEC0148187.1 sugar ABC transporter permease [Paenibacillus alginolyticus]
MKRIGLERKKMLAGYVYISPWLVGFLLFMVFPLVYSLWLSFHDVEGVGSFQLKYVGWLNFKHAFVLDPQFVPLFVSVIQDTVINTPLIIVFSLFIAILLNHRIRGRAFFRAAFFLPVLIGSGMVLQQLLYAGVGQKTLVNGIGLPESAFIYMGPAFSQFVFDLLSRLTLIFWKTGVQILLFLAGLQGISPSLYESSKCDGATEWEMFWKITLPLVSPVILLNLVYTLVDSFTDVTNRIMLYIRDIGFVKIELGYAAALGWIYFALVFVIIVIIFAASRRFIFYSGER